MFSWKKKTNISHVIASSSRALMSFCLFLRTPLGFCSSPSHHFNPTFFPTSLLPKDSAPKVSPTSPHLMHTIVLHLHDGRGEVRRTRPNRQRHFTDFQFVNTLKNSGKLLLILNGHAIEYWCNRRLFNFGDRWRYPPKTHPWKRHSKGYFCLYNYMNPAKRADRLENNYCIL